MEHFACGQYSHYKCEAVLLFNKIKYKSSESREVIQTMPRPMRVISISWLNPLGTKLEIFSNYFIRWTIH